MLSLQACNTIPTIIADQVLTQATAPQQQDECYYTPRGCLPD
jgi:hypothetical protein